MSNKLAVNLDLFGKALEGLVIEKVSHRKFFNELADPIKEVRKEISNITLTHYSMFGYEYEHYITLSEIEREIDRV